MSTVSYPAPPAPWVPSTAAFGARLALVRNHEGWNIKEAALACRIPEASWRSWENGAHPRDVVGICHSIADQTGCDFFWLVDGQPGPGGPSFQGPDTAGELPRTESNRQPAGYGVFTQRSRAAGLAGVYSLRNSHDRHRLQACKTQAA